MRLSVDWSKITTESREPVLLPWSPCTQKPLKCNIQAYQSLCDRYYASHVPIINFLTEEKETEHQSVNKWMTQWPQENFYGRDTTGIRDLYNFLLITRKKQNIFTKN